MLFCTSALYPPPEGSGFTAHLIKVLLQPENEGILKALGINDSKDIETQLIEMMNKAFKNEDIVLKTLSKQGAEVVKKLK